MNEDIKESHKKDKHHIRNKILVNLITFIRSLGSIAIVPIFLTKGAFATGLAAIGFFATDFIDGLLARKLHVQSFFGSLLDGMSDKAFGIVCLVLLSTLNPIFLLAIAAEIGILVVNYNSIQRGNNAQSSIAGKAKTCLLAASIVGSFFCYSTPSLKEVLNFININSLNTLLENNPKLLSTILAIPAIGSSVLVAADYQIKANKQEQRKEAKQTCEESSKLEVAPSNDQTYDKPSGNLEERRELLRQKKAIIEEAQERKSNKELLHDLFDTEFYLEHKDDGIKKLLYKKR